MTEETAEKQKRSDRDLLIKLLADVEHIQEDVKDVKTRLDKKFVTKAEFDAKIMPLQRFVYGLIALIGSGILALLWPVLTGGSP